MGTNPLRAETPAFDNSYARLPDTFFVRRRPVTVPAPQLVRMNGPLATALGFDPEAGTAAGWAEIFAGNVALPGDDPLAMAYAGHQFGSFVPQLGDGRALLLGEVLDRDGVRHDIQLKGAGRTPFSRMGDGRAALGPVLREFIVSEAMSALGIATTRALAAVTTGEPVYRETPLPGAIFTRVARSHVRVGTFQYFAARGDTDSLRHLADHVIDRHYPEVRSDSAPYTGLLRAVVERQAALIAQWLGVGFIHGVMNTDNMSISGETIDFGPCAFLDEYDPTTVFSSIDHAGRYAYGSQPKVAQWNLTRLAETLLPLIDVDEGRAIASATEVVNGFGARFEECWLDEMRRKLGLAKAAPGDAELIRRFLALMQAARADFTLTFRHLAEVTSAGAPPPSLTQRLGDAPPVADWLAAWRGRLSEEGLTADAASQRLRAANPALIPRNHRVEQAIAAAVAEADFGPFHRLVDLLATPFDTRADGVDEARPPEPHELVTETFCGT